MKQILQRPIFVVFLCLSLIATCIQQWSWAATEQPGTFKITILYMNDPHAHYESKPSSKGSGFTGGFAKAQSLIQEIRETNNREGRRTILLLGGDLLTGTAFSTVFKGAMGIELLNTMGLTAMVVGNHEFDYGVQNLLGRLKPKAQFPMLGANILDANGDSLFDRIVELSFPNGSALAPVVIIGLTTPQTPSISSPKNVEGITFSDPLVAARNILSRVASDSLVIVMTHLGLAMDQELVAACPRINVVIGGHSHTVIHEPIRASDSLICQAGAYSEYLGRLDLDFKDGKIIHYSGKLLALAPDVKEDPEISRVIGAYRDLMSPEYERIIGESSVSLEASRSAVRSDAPNRLGQLIAGLMAQSVGSDIALINGGAIRSGIDKGRIKLKGAFSVLPFDDTVVKVSMKGSDLESALQMSSVLPTDSGGKLQHFGLELDSSSSINTIKNLNGLKFDPSTVYTVAIGQFLESGGDGYHIFKDKAENKVESGLLIRDLLVNFIRVNNPVTDREIDKVIHRVPSETNAK